MSDKRYPTRMHEVLGVEPFEKFQVVGGYEGRNYSLDKDGWMCWGESNWESDVEDVYNAINNGIIRRPRLTQEQVEQLKAAQLLVNAKWLAKDKDGGVVLFGRKPNRDGDMSAWIDDDCYYWWFLPSDTPLSGLVSWSDPEPLDIVQTLRDAGAEVEG